MNFYVVDVDATASFEIVVEADSRLEAKDLALDEAKKRIKSPVTLDLFAISTRESDES